MYNDKVMQHFSNPRHTGELADANGIGTVGNPACGDMMKLYLKIENDQIVDIRFKTFGCAAAIATSSIASEMVLSKSLDEAAALTAQDIVDELGGLPERKILCSTLAPDAIKAAIEDFQSRK
jgi:nitrogen fixation NifU-like protein